jgi:hypothetical protein
MSDRPQMICKGEILGSLQDPQEYFDSPRSEMELKIIQAQTALLTRVIEAKLGGAIEKPKAQVKEEVPAVPRVRTPQQAPRVLCTGPLRWVVLYENNLPKRCAPGR